MKNLTDYIAESFTSNKPLIKLCDKLYKKFGRQYSEFENIKKTGEFHLVVMADDEEHELQEYEKYGLTPEILKLADRYQSDQGNDEIFYEFNINDIVNYFDYDYVEVWDQITSWFNHLA